MCWGVFFSLVILHYINFTDTDAKKRAVGDCVYYAVLIAWLVGTIVHYAFSRSWYFYKQICSFSKLITTKRYLLTLYYNSSKTKDRDDH
jgi:hypothetical protein